MEEGTKKFPDHERLEMLFSLYYPKLKPDFDSFKQVVFDVAPKWSSCEKSLENGQKTTPNQTTEFAASWLLIEKSAGELKRNLSQLMSAPKPF